LLAVGHCAETLPPFDSCFTAAYGSSKVPLACVAVGSSTDPGAQPAPRAHAVARLSLTAWENSRSRRQISGGLNNPRILSSSLGLQLAPAPKGPRKDPRPCSCKLGGALLTLWPWSSQQPRLTLGDVLRPRDAARAGEPTISDKIGAGPQSLSHAVFAARVAISRDPKTMATRWHMAGRHAFDTVSTVRRTRRSPATSLLLLQRCWAR